MANCGKKPTMVVVAVQGAPQLRTKNSLLIILFLDHVTWNSLKMLRLFLRKKVWKKSLIISVGNFPGQE